MEESSVDNNSWGHVTRNFWLSEGLQLESGARLEDIEATELCIGFTFPPDMKELYQVVNGFKNWGWTKNMISVWPMERIREEYGTSRDKIFIGFCDYPINSHCVGFFKDRSGIYKSYDEFNPIAESFKEAIDLINTGSDLIF